ncbi:perlucin-like protein [Pecten maximus]|uniref:perlucin-like protein n=1 Tax=Pecten maximus TaxID=6579 RepID=UPI0014589E31|nr:perlucin-like protein [Pecten maximus]
MKCSMLVFVLIDISYQQSILPEHRKNHCQAVRTTDIMNYVMPGLQYLIREDYEKLSRRYDEILAILKGGILLTCPEGWVYHDDNCYLFRRTKSTWQEAREFCQLKGAYLAEIRGNRENEFVKSEMRKIRKAEHPRDFRSYFIGGTDRDREGVWIWVRTGERIAYKDFAPSEPNNGRGEGFEDCLMMFGEQDFLWNDDRCTSTYFGVCKTSVRQK